MDTNTTATPPATTTLGTPTSTHWDADWLAEVDHVETDLGHRICGAHTPAWTPCKLISTHPNGRCRFHGGAPGIGAPGGNRNAWIHGLYSRRLQQCGDHCPLWNHCPMAGKDVIALTPPERPHCVYEKEEYEALLSTFSLEKEKVEPKETTMNSTSNQSESSTMSTTSTDSLLRVSAPPREPGLIEKNVALFQVLLTRAQAALGIARLTDDTGARTLNYHMHSTKVGALVQAQLHIARELRQWLKLLPNFDLWRGLPARGPSPSKPPHDKPEPEGLPMRMLKMLQESEGVLEQVLGVGPGEASPFTPRFNKRPPPEPTPA